MATRAQKTIIQLQTCPGCAGKHRRWIGPEPRNIGLFNFNNQIVFSHDLLDEYTSAFTSSETPFAAWVLTVSRRYDVHQSTEPFVSEKMFRNIWFAYIRLQRLDTDLNCPDCGPDPQDTIWDGVTLAFSQKHLSPSLRPPTAFHENSVQRQKVRYLPGGQLIHPALLRKALRFIVEGRSLAINPDDDGSDIGDDDSSKTKQQLIARVNTIPDVCTQLKAVNRGLGALFSHHYGVATLSTGTKPPIVYRQLFIQVSANT
jgi:hypothetical protein